METIIEPVYLTLDQAAAQLHVSHQTMRNWTDKKIPGFQTAGGHRRYRERDVQVLAWKQHREALGHAEHTIMTIQVCLQRRGDDITVSQPGGENMTVTEALEFVPKVDVFPMSFGNDDCWEDRLENQITQGAAAACEITPVEDLRITEEYVITDQWVMAVGHCLEDILPLLRKGIQEACVQLQSLEFVYGVCGVKRPDGQLIPTW